MKTPEKVIIEITGDTYSHKILDSNDQVIWESSHKMVSRGESRSVSGDIWDHDISDEYPDLAESIEELSFGPFGIARCLHDLIA